MLCRCGCGCDPCRVDRIDLNPTVCHPVHEVLAVHVNGKSVGIDGWRIDEQRYLVRPPKKGWPQQSLQSNDGDECTWSVTVRYGTRPPWDVTDARDEQFLRELAKCPKPNTSNACDISALTEVTDKKGTVRRKEPDLLECLVRKYGQKRRKAMYIDPAGQCDYSGDIVTMIALPDPDAATLLHGAGCDPETFAQGWAADAVAQAPAQVGQDAYGLPTAGCGTC